MALAKILAALLMAMALCEVSIAATVYHVGDSTGWTIGKVNYTLWSQTKDFVVGDTISTHLPLRLPFSGSCLNFACCFFVAYSSECGIKRVGFGLVYCVSHRIIFLFFIFYQAKQTQYFPGNPERKKKTWDFNSIIIYLFFVFTSNCSC